MRLPIRASLTLWYSLVLAIILAAFAAGVYAFVAAEERSAVDRILRERAESFAGSLANESKEQPEASAVLEVAHDFASHSDDDVIIYDGAGKLVFRSPSHELHATPPRLPMGFTTIGGARVISSRAGSYVFMSGESLAGRYRALDRLRSAFLALIPIAIFLAAISGYLLAARSLRPLNQALAALERSLDQQKQLLADTSHELRTPVTIIRSEAEVTLTRDRDAQEYRRALEVIRSESSHLTNLLEGVLLLASGGAQEGAIEMTSVQLEQIISDSAHALDRIAQTHRVALSCNTDGPMPMRGNGELLRRMLLNLADNAIKFCEPGGWVRIDARRNDSKYVIRVSDNGRGIPTGAQDKIFDRFFRADDARSHNGERETDGAGLGLPIARWIAQLHGGELRLLSSSPSGSVFEAELPAS